VRLELLIQAAKEDNVDQSLALLCGLLPSYRPAARDVAEARPARSDSVRVLDVS
jgi:hypothetical protein